MGADHGSPRRWTGGGVDLVNPALGTLETGTVDCPAGPVLLGGGATATTNQTSNSSRFALQTSAPVDADSWRGIAVVTTSLAGGQRVTIRPDAICTT